MILMSYLHLILGYQGADDEAHQMSRIRQPNTQILFETIVGLSDCLFGAALSVIHSD